jgi:uncharacterized protein YndB with AHSA1/START domain
MAEQDRTLVDMVVEAPTDVVWRALREPDEIHRWFGWDDDGLDAEIQQIFLDGEVTEEEVAETGLRTLAWRDGDRLVVEPGPGDDATRVQVLRRTTADAEVLGPAYDAIDEGWITFAQQLRFALERHRGEDRRTVWADGIDLGPEGDPLLARLDLRRLGDEPVGSSYTIERADGTGFGGEIFVQTDLQLGLTVTQERDALLVVARRPPAAAPPNGTVMFLLSTFGFDDDQLIELTSRWTRWWSPAGESST